MSKRIAIDLTPILSGGENGGAKIFVLELVKNLGLMLPNTTFILLTKEVSHHELSILDNQNISRYLIADLNEKIDLRKVSEAFKLICRRLIGCLSDKTRGRIKRVVKKFNFLGRRTILRPSILTGLNIDLLFCPFTRPTFYSEGIPTVSTVYDLQYKKYPEFFQFNDAVQRAETFELASKYSSRLVAISNFTRQEILDSGMTPSSKIKTIYLRMASRGIACHSRDENFLLRHGINKGLYLLYPANFWKHKNHELLLMAFAQARYSGLNSQIKLVCTGVLDDRGKWLRNAVESLGLKENVIFPGFVSDTEYAQLLINSRGLVFPSLYEGFGLPIIEAMAAGVPVACGNLTSLPEIAGDAAILFDPRKPDEIKASIISLVNDEKLVTTLKRRGLERASEFLDAKKMAFEYVEVFQKLANNKFT